jgi:hypothetical protein
MFNLDDWSVNTIKPRSFSLKSTYFDNTMAYIKRNRVKHDLPESDVLIEIIESFVTQEE